MPQTDKIVGLRGESKPPVSTVGEVQPKKYPVPAKKPVKRPPINFESVRIKPDIYIAVLLDEVNEHLIEVKDLIAECCVVKHEKPLIASDVKTNKIIGLLEQLVEASRKKQELLEFNTGLQTITIPVTTVPEPTDTNPATGYTRVPVWEEFTPNRLSPKLYFLNVGPGTVFVIVSHNTETFSTQEMPVYAGTVYQFYDVFELRVRVNLANTQFIASESELTPIYYANFDDRNAVAAHIIQPYAAFGPHAITVRASYTVPAGLRARISGCYAFTEVDVVAGVPGRRSLAIGLVSGGVGFSVMSASLGAPQNTVGDLKENFIGYAYTLLAGEEIQITTQNLSNAGQNLYFGSAIITQYFPIPT